MKTRYRLTTLLIQITNIMNYYDKHKSYNYKVIGYSILIIIIILLLSVL